MQGTTTDDPIAARLAQELDSAQRELQHAHAALVAAATEDERAAEADRQAWRLYEPHDGKPGSSEHRTYQPMLAAMRAAAAAAEAHQRAMDRVRALEAKVQQLADPAELERRYERKLANDAKFGRLRAQGTAANGAAVAAPGAKRSNAVAAAQLPQGGAELQQAMDQHRAGFDAYVAARKAGDDAAKATHAPAYREYKRAYAALLKLRKEAAQ